MIAELKEELEARDSDLLKLQQERLELIKDARAAKDYRDELDCLQQKVIDLEKMRSENDRMKKKLEEMEFFKSRVAQLKEENDLIHESCSVLEEQLEQLQRKAGAHFDVEQKLTECQNQVKLHLNDLAEERKKREQLLIENGRLERELEFERHNNAALLRKIENSNEPTSARENFDSLGSQLADDDKKRILQLELENRKLRSKIDNSSEPDDSGPLRAELLRTEIELSQKTEQCLMADRQIQQFELTLSQLTAQYKAVCDLCEAIKEERDAAQQNLQEARRNFSEFQSHFQNELKTDLSNKLKIMETSLKESEEKSERYRDEKISLEKQLEAMNKNEKEKAILEKKLEMLRDDHNNLQIEADDLKYQLEILKQSMVSLERQKRDLEKEKNMLKEKVESIEIKYDDAKVKLMNMENLEKKLAANEKNFLEKQNKICDLESENRQLNHRVKLEIEKTDRFRDDLIFEKSRCSDLVSRLRSVCNTIQLNGGKCDIPEGDEQIIATIDDIIMKALVTARREADALRLQQHTQLAELNDLRRDIEKLR
ncbi:unnamed protein product [Dracunculus medinensis]|uniref:GRIP domain-containing protein n=1 Tax=Dracunculus medinensis TaxID=318479 RepID=A0A0N4U1C2_DRAME|nr:unnamed protein product [Dracunculus medinensis]